MNELELSGTGLDNVFTIELNGSKRIITKSLVTATSGEKIIRSCSEEYRIWNPFHSKLAAILLKNAVIPLMKDSAVLYLGAANGTTVSHVSDIVPDGTVYGVEFSPRAMQDLIHVSARRTNLIPILADAMQPGSYRNIVPEVDIIYQDVAQREQARIAVRNGEMFLKKGGFLVLIIKSRSIDVNRKTRDVAACEIKLLEGYFEILGFIDLEPFHSGHVAVLAKRT
ncbi:MAG: fibrillarin-like rRNA/tRNA 2'-O-methyltransferase [Candidatus Methanoperedens sp.]